MKFQNMIKIKYKDPNELNEIVQLGSTMGLSAL